ALALGARGLAEAEAVGVHVHPLAREPVDALAPERRVLALVVLRAGRRAEAEVAGAVAVDRVRADALRDAAAVRRVEDVLAADNASVRAGRVRAAEAHAHARALRHHRHRVALVAVGLAHVRRGHAHREARVADLAHRTLAVLAAGRQARVGRHVKLLAAEVV